MISEIHATAPWHAHTWYWSIETVVIRLSQICCQKYAQLPNNRTHLSSLVHLHLPNSCCFSSPIWLQSLSASFIASSLISSISLASKYTEICECGTSGGVRDVVWECLQLYGPSLTRRFDHPPSERSLNTYLPSACLQPLHPLWFLKQVILGSWHLSPRSFHSCAHTRLFDSIPPSGGDALHSMAHLFQFMLWNVVFSVLWMVHTRKDIEFKKCIWFIHFYNAYGLLCSWLLS